MRNAKKVIVGIDVGGANLKLAIWQNATEPSCVSSVFPLWKQPDNLKDAVRRLFEQLFGSALNWHLDELAVTMTGELADCFATRREGVERILCQLQSVVSPDRVCVYAVGGEWLTIDEAVAAPWQVAASNWHALANWLCNWPPTRPKCRRAVLVDVGSTTTDVIPLSNSVHIGGACTDRQRLEQRQLVYTGIARTPVCAITSSLSLSGRSVPVMAEVFARSDDAYLALHLMQEDLDDMNTADGRPRSAAAARGRLARMVAEDTETLTVHEIEALAEQVVDAQARQVADAIEFNLARLADDGGEVASTGLPELLASGHGWPLLDRACRLVKAPHTVFALSSLIPAEASRCAPAAAVAWLKQFAVDQTKRDGELLA